MPSIVVAILLLSHACTTNFIASAFTILGLQKGMPHNTFACLPLPRWSFKFLCVSSML